MASSQHSMYENEHAEYLFAKVLSPTAWRGPLEQGRLDACHHLARLVEQYQAAREALEAVGDYAFGTWEFDEERRQAGRVAEGLARAVLDGSNPAKMEIDPFPDGDPPLSNPAKERP